MTVPAETETKGSSPRPGPSTHSRRGRGVTLSSYDRKHGWQAGHLGLRRLKEDRHAASRRLGRMRRLCSAVSSLDAQRSESSRQPGETAPGERKRERVLCEATTSNTKLQSLRENDRARSTSGKRETRARSRSGRATTVDSPAPTTFDALSLLVFRLVRSIALGSVVHGEWDRRASVPRSVDVGLSRARVRRRESMHGQCSVLSHKV